MSRGTENRRRSEQVGVRLTPDEKVRAEQLAAAARITLGDLFRCALVSDEQIAVVLYRMNGSALYGRNLGDWDDPASDIGRNEFEQLRWRRQAAYLRAATATPTQPDDDEEQR